MARSPDIILKDRIYVARDTKLFTRAEIQSRYSLKLYDEKSCVKCPNKPMRHSEDCEICPAYKGTFKFSKDETIQGRDYNSLPLADIQFIRKAVAESDREFSVVKKLCLPRMKSKLKFTGKLFGPGATDSEGNPRANQERLVAKWMKKKNGIIQAAPRTGKCLTGETLVSSSKGFLSLEELITAEGYNKRKISVSTPKGIERTSHAFKDPELSRVVAITTHNGFSLKGTPEHPVLTLSPKLKHKWKNLSDIVEGDHIVSTGPATEFVWPTTDAANKNQATILGHMVGNGRSNVLFSNDPFVYKQFCKAVKKETGRKPGLVEQSGLNNWQLPKGYKPSTLIELGYSPLCSSDKEIPLSVRKSSRKIMKRFLNAYFACDSGVNGYNIELVTASKKLAQQLHVILLQGFGILGTLKPVLKSASNSKNPTLRVYYRIMIAGSHANRFVKTFPDAKVSRTHGGRFVNPKITAQEFHVDYVPYVKRLVAKVYDKARVYTGTKDTRINLEDGSVKQLPRPFDTRNRSTNCCDRMPRKTYNTIDWQKASEISLPVNKALAKALRGRISEGFHYERVVKVATPATKRRVYDITVPGSHSFYANGLASHNTVIAVNIACMLGVRTIIIADRFELLNQFYWTFCGRKSNEYRDGIKPMTNAPKLRKKKGYPVVKVAETIKDLLNDDYDVILVNPQKFKLDQASKVEKYVKGRFGLVVVDECLPGNAMVTMADGTRKAIKEIVEGDRVLSFNEITKRVEARRVKGTKRTWRMEELLEIKHSGGILKCTAGHKILTQRGWIRADSLSPGDNLLNITQRNKV